MNGKRKSKQQVSQQSDQSSSSDLMDKNNCNMETYEGSLRTIEPNDYDQIKTLFQGFFKQKDWQKLSSSVGDMLLKLQETTDVVDIDESVVLVNTVIPVTLMIQNQFIQKIVKLLAKELGKEFIIKQKIGVIVNLKYVNTPCDLSVQVYDSMIKNLQYIQTEEYSESDYSRAFFDCGYYALITKCMKDDENKLDYSTMYHQEYEEFIKYAYKIIEIPNKPFDQHYDYGLVIIISKLKFEKCVQKFQV